MTTATLALRLAGPLQSWGDDSRFTTRSTRHAPTKSGVIGMLAAATGRRRTEPIEDLAALRFGVRIDQQGRLLQDFHTAIDWRNEKSKPLTSRHYLCDAKFVVGIEGPVAVLEGLAAALRSPVFPVFLGRRSCVPAGTLVLGIRGTSLEETLRTEPWQASDWYRRMNPTQTELPISRDARPEDETDESIRDIPVSFDPRDRRHALRAVVHDWAPLAGTTSGPGITRATGDHDPCALLGGV